MRLQGRSLLVGFVVLGLFACGEDDAAAPAAATSDPVVKSDDAPETSGAKDPVDAAPPGAEDAGAPTDDASAPSHTDEDAGDAEVAAVPFVGRWALSAGQDRTAAGFTELDFAADGTWTETGRTDDAASRGTYTEPASIDIASDFGDPPAGLTGPYVGLVDELDGRWVYGVSQTASHLSLTLYAQTRGMGLRWANPPVVIELDRVVLPAGTWTVAAADVAAAGFDSVTVGAAGSWTETGHTPEIADDDAGPVATWGSIDISSDFGDPPAGMTGPYLSFTDTQDGQWVYGFARTGTSLVLTRYAERRGQGLRWVDPPVVLHLGN